MESFIVLGLLVAAVWLFAREVFPVEIVTLMLLVALTATGILTPAQAFQGFSSDIIIILASIFVVCGALNEAGVLEAAGGHLGRVAAYGLRPLLACLMGVTGGISAFMNNTTVTAVMLQPTLALAKQAAVSPSKLLIPVAYASILGGTCTLIGTSTNVAVSGYIKSVGLEPIGLFEITPIGVVLLVCGVVYLTVFGPRILPERAPVDASVPEEDPREFLSEILVLKGSPLIGQPVLESGLAQLDLRVIQVLRGNEKVTPGAETRICGGDVLVVNAPVGALMQVKSTAGIEIRAETQEAIVMRSPDSTIAKLLVTPQSEIRGRTIGEAQFFQRYGMTVLAVYHHGMALRTKLSHARLRMGDVLLVQGPAERLKFFRASGDFAVLEERAFRPFHPRNALVVASLFIAAIVVGGAGWMPLPICFLGAAILCVILRCMPVARAYEYIEWRLLILIAGMTSFGLAMDMSGASAMLASGIVGVLQPFGPHALLAGFCVLTVALTQPMSNAAAALVVLPVAVESAKMMGVDPRTFAIAIMLAASVSFIAPLEPSCILVYGPGRYKFSDYVKAGLGLTLCCCAIVIFVVPIFWPM